MEKSFYFLLSHPPFADLIIWLNFDLFKQNYSRCQDGAGQEKAEDANR